MSDCIVKIVPKDPLYKVSEQMLKKAKELLEAKLSCDSINFECYDTPAFIDCGSNLERIVCPQCGAVLDFDWWGEAMEKANEKQFLELETELPCCQKTVSLNNINYYFPCAFACCEITVLNPDFDIENDIVDCIQKILCTEIRVVRAHM